MIRVTENNKEKGILENLLLGVLCDKEETLKDMGNDGKLTK